MTRLSQLSTDHQAARDAARYAQQVFRRYQQLIPFAQPVFRAWLKAQSGGSVEDVSQTEIYQWLRSLHPGFAHTEYMLLLAEIAWLETLTEHICDSCSAEVFE